MIEALLTAILVMLAIIAVCVRGLSYRVSEWRDVWGSNNMPASDYHAKEILKVAKETAHYLALAQLRAEKNDSDKLRL
ncbi:MAG: hypothetical protein E5X67_32715 [Mesorhizobium sp.]|uniref:hypothetical protein n=1 Tax=Mesorhizobium sp. TaxID=1871066 RepID=UPI00122454D9|nr:hypothetical protein [Mesorhizobium sp.]TIP23588.1 MAG: hypothetical protein E5X67_32715 [Mesorhizobium sp.]